MSLNFDEPKDRMTFYKSKEWRHLRRWILKRDNFECQECRRNGRVMIEPLKPDKHKVLEIHHIQPLVERPDLSMDVDNLETLCIKCHNKFENRFQFRPYKPKVNKWADDEKW